MSWNYRVFRHPDGYLAIHETYYGVVETGHAQSAAEPNGFCVEPAEVTAENDEGDDAAIQSLRLTLQRMLECLEKPILPYTEA